MSALTDLFTSMANKIRSKVGGSQTYTPLQMVSAIDDVYDAGAASVSPTSITPSNASPVALTANTAVKPTAAGYAISSYTSKTPNDSNPPSVSSGNIVRITGNSGYLYKTQQASATVKHYTTNVTFSDNTSYVYIATGKYAGLSITRGNLTSAAKIRVYIKINGSYYDLSGQLATVNGTFTTLAPTTGTYVNTSGELYLKKDSGSNFTSTAFDFQYVG